jgi:hypothetical protein
MLTRRNFIAGACCLLNAGPAAAAGRKERSFICGATHAPPLGWVGPSGIPLAGASFNDQQAWRVEDGATPKSDVITLDVHFMNGPKSDHRKVERIASEWTDKALGERVRFRFGRPRAASQIRILVDPNKGYSSKVGRDNLGVPKNQPTMHLADAEHRPVLHEFGHVLGLRHEHHHPASGIVWNKPVVYRELKQQFGWSKAMVDSNIFERFTQDFSCGGEAFDKNSVMIYEIPKRWTKNGFLEPAQHHYLAGRPQLPPEELLHDLRPQPGASAMRFRPQGVSAKARVRPTPDSPWTRTPKPRSPPSRSFSPTWWRGSRSPSTAAATVRSGRCSPA